MENKTRDTKTSLVDIPKAIKLRYQKGLSYTEIGKVFGVNRGTAFTALRPFDKIIKSQGEIEGFNQNHVQIIESALLELAGKLNDTDKLEKASLNNVAYTYDRLFNALRLLKGESTANIHHAHTLEQDLNAIDAQIAAIEGKVIAGESEEDRINREIKELEDKAQE